MCEPTKNKNIDFLSELQDHGATEFDRDYNLKLIEDWIDELKVEAGKATLDYEAADRLEMLKVLQNIMMKSWRLRDETHQD